MKRMNKTIGTQGAQAQGNSPSRHLFRVVYEVRGGIVTSGLALGASEDDVRDTYSRMNCENEPLTVREVYPEPA